MAELDNVENVTKPMVEARIRWVEELRSGKYTQLKNGLKSSEDPNNRCCLGVACEPRVTGIVLQEYVKPYNPLICFSEPHDPHPEEGAYAALPDPISRALGITNPLPAVNNEHLAKATPLSYLNDTGTPFSEIADYIERDYIDPFRHLLEENNE